MFGWKFKWNVDHEMKYRKVVCGLWHNKLFGMDMFNMIFELLVGENGDVHFTKDHRNFQNVSEKSFKSVSIWTKMTLL